MGAERFSMKFTDYVQPKVGSTKWTIRILMKHITFAKPNIGSAKWGRIISIKLIVSKQLKISSTKSGRIIFNAARLFCTAQGGFHEMGENDYDEAHHFSNAPNRLATTTTASFPGVSDPTSRPLKSATRPSPPPPDPPRDYKYSSQVIKLTRLRRLNAQEARNLQKC